MYWKHWLGILAVAGVAVGVPASASAKDKVKAKVHKGALVVTGNGGADAIALRLAGGDPTTLDVIADGSVIDSFDRSRFTTIDVQAGGGDDTLRIDESNGVFTDTEDTTLEGEAGSDTITGGSSAETLVGGPGADSVDGGRGSDLAELGGGDDSFVWNPGDGSDVVQGDDGTDTLQFNGANVNEHIALAANGVHAVLTRDVANITMDNVGVEDVNVAAKGGTDAIVVHDLAGTDVTSVATDLGADGQADAVSAEGTAGTDSIDVHAGTVTGLAAAVSVTNADPTDTLSADGLGGDDHFTADPASATLIEALVGGEGNDAAFAQGTNANDTIGIANNGPSAAVFSPGTPGRIDVQAESLRVNGLGGDDTINGQNGLSTLTALTIDGGAGNDTIGGGDGDDVLFGGDGNDTVDGNRGADTAFLGAGDDTFVWDPGDGSDIVEGQDGTDELLFNGSNIGEHFDLSANGVRLRFTRDVGAITMDTGGVEAVQVVARSGTDAIVVRDLTGTDVRSVATDLGADAQADTVTAEGTAGADAIDVGKGTVSGLAATVSVTNADATDTLSADGLGGDDRL